MNFDLILMDLDMPVMDGYEATEHIRKQHKGIPVLALTAASFDDMHSYLSRKGFDGIVQKPFRPDNFHAIVSLLKKKNIPDLNLEVYESLQIQDIPDLQVWTYRF
jgi:CheY-like chemotaxis protein